MGQEVRREIDALATAKSDSTQWSLAQADVELLALKWAILAAEVDPNASVADVRSRFNILYSRIGTITNSPIYENLRAEASVLAALARIRDYLSTNVPFIDADDVTLRARLSALAQDTEAIRADIRLISLTGVSVIARAADGQREGIAETLAWVSALTTGLFLVLIMLLLVLIHLARRERERSRAHSLVRARMAAIVSTSLDAIMVVDRKGRVVEFNAAAEALFGYTQSEAIGAQMEELIIPDRFKQAHHDGMARYLTTGERKVIGKGRVQLEARRKSGEVFPVELSISTADSVDGELFVSFARDISRRVAAEQALIKARDDAVAGEKAKADLIAVMSHEMRTPLNGMLGTLELMDREGRSAKDTEYLGIIRASGRQLLHHVDNVLDISRAEAGKMVPMREVFSLPALVRELVESQRGVAAHRGNTLAHAVNTVGLDYVLGDPVRIRQVLLNLVGNAIKFTRNGAITVEAERLAQSDLVEFRVIDTGIGIDHADQDRVFDEFVTLDPSFSRAVGGTGLGLAIVRRVAVALGGSVGVESEKGSGSLFWIRLPLPVADRSSTSTRQTGRGATSVAMSPSGPLRVLIVEDNSINRIVLRDLLEQDGHQVDEAHDGQEGVECVKRKSYDLVFMDISMPVMDGVAATRAIRQDEGRGTRLPMIALTAHARREDEERFRAAGLDDILIKPITRVALREIIGRVYGQSKNHDAQVGHSDPGQAVLDLAHIDQLAITLGKERTHQLVAAFLAETDASIGSITQAIAQNEENVSLGQRIHHAAGSCALIGASRLRETLIGLEDRVTQGAYLEDNDIAALHQIWDETSQALNMHAKLIQDPTHAA
ncbi:response regulator [Rhodobacterales bacterium LSUCC0031]|nr:response regulator [Rhodobacterales bacterium LSUCC0031]